VENSVSSNPSQSRSPDVVESYTPIKTSDPKVSTFPCHICNKILSSSSNRSRHIKQKHAIQRNLSPAVTAPVPASRSIVAPTISNVTSSPSSNPPAQISRPLSINTDNNASDNMLQSWKQLHPPSPVGTDESDGEDENVNKNASIDEDEGDFVDLMADTYVPKSNSSSTLMSSAAKRSRNQLDTIIDAASDTSSFNTTGQVNMESAQPFFAWLGEVAVNESEKLVKTVRMTKPSQIRFVSWNMKFLFNILVSKSICSGSFVSLALFTQLDTCQAVYQFLVDRKSGPCRIHGLFLLIKKIIVYIASTESLSLRQYNPPNVYPSYQYVSSIVSESTKARKSLEHDRMAGIESNPESSSSGSSSSKTTAPLSKAELQTLVSGCLRYLKAASASKKIETNCNEAIKYAAFLVCAFLSLGLAPRTQVLCELELDKSFVRDEEGRFWVKLTGQSSKNKKPVVLPVPTELSAYFNVYISIARETILKTAIAKRKSNTDNNSSSTAYVFVNKQGEKRNTFKDWCRYVTTVVVGRPVSTHTFRASVITTYYESNASNSEMENLSRFMNHDSSVQKRFYYKPAYKESVLKANKRMSEILLNKDSEAQAQESSSSDLSSSTIPKIDTVISETNSSMQNVTNTDEMPTGI
jgi:integrase